MKTLSRNTVYIMFVVLLLLSLPSGICLGSDGKLSFDRESARTLGKIAVNKLREMEKEREAGAESLKNMISSDLKAHKERETSWEKTGENLSGEQRERWKREVGLILEGINRDKAEGVGDIFEKWEIEDMLKCPDDVVSSYLNRSLGETYDPSDTSTVFSGARKEACDEQLKEMVSNTYPTESQVEKIAGNSFERGILRSELLKILAGNQKVPAVFEENEKVLGDNFIDPILDDALKQLEEQQNIAKNFLGSGYTPEDIEQSGFDKLSKDKKRLEKERKGQKVTSKVYGLFPKAAERIRSRAKKLASERFQNELGNIIVEIGKDAVKELILGNLPAHTNESKSRESVLEHFKKRITDSAVSYYASKVPKEKQPKFRKYLEGLVSTDGDCKDALDDLVYRSLKDDIAGARKEISEEQFREFFGPLDKGTWKPDKKKEIESRLNSFSIFVAEPLEKSGISSKSFDPDKMLEETISKVKAKLEALISAGVKALRKQMKIVNDTEGTVKSDIKNLQDLTLESLMSYYSDKVLSKWSDSSPPQDYKALFDSVNDEIRRRSKDIVKDKTDRRVKIEEDRIAALKKAEDDRAAALKAEEERKRQQAVSDSMEQLNGIFGEGTVPGTGTGSQDQDPNASTDSDGKMKGRGGPNLGGGGGGMPDTNGVNRIDAIIDIDYEDGNFTANIMFPEDTPYSFKFELSRGGSIDNAYLTRTMATVQKLFEKWLNSFDVNDKKVELFVIARIFELRVYYGIVYSFRESLRRAGKAAEIKDLKINWYDGLFNRRFKGSPKIEETIRIRSRSLKSQKKMV